MVLTNCTYDHIRALKGLVSGWKYSYKWLISTRNLQVAPSRD